MIEWKEPDEKESEPEPADEILFYFILAALAILVGIAGGDWASARFP